MRPIMAHATSRPQPRQRCVDPVDLGGIDRPPLGLPEDTPSAGAAADPVAAGRLVDRLQAAHRNPRADLFDDAEEGVAVGHFRLADAHGAGCVGGDTGRSRSSRKVSSEQAPKVHARQPTPSRGWSTTVERLRLATLPIEYGTG